MAFTSIPNSSIDADSPLDTTLFTYLRDNDDYLKARFNPATGHNHDGTTDSGAQVSVPDGFVTTAKIADGNVTTTKIKRDIGNFLTISADSIHYSDETTTYVKVKEIIIGIGGNFRVKFDLLTTFPYGRLATARIYINNVAVGIERTSSSPVWVTFSEDLPLSLGDAIQIFAHIDNGSGVFAEVQNFRLYTNFGDIVTLD